MPGIKYHYAVDKDGNLVDIASVSEENRKNKFYCLSCGGELRPRLGCVKAHHFAHKSDAPHCCQESYLHKLAKRKLKEKFCSGKPFKISFYQEVECSDKDSCQFYRQEECCASVLKSYDLKQHYDTCKEEQPIGDFIADLLLSSKSKPSTPPILIEIRVTHKCEEAKVSSGYKIIELQVTSEENIKTLFESPIVESAHPCNSNDSGAISFHSFKKNATDEPLEMRSIPKFYLFKSGKAYVSNMNDYPSCREVCHKGNPNAILELGIDRFYLDQISPYDIGYITASNLGQKTKNCQLCKYRKDVYGYANTMNLCCLYKSKNTPQYPNGPEAKNCQYYRENAERIQEINKAINETPIVIAK
ncbi:MAG: competence protein CoiA family protein [Bacteroidales bacterium]|nr:competence protein CoiA family protein [Bacteroidales bacterium]